MRPLIATLCCLATATFADDDDYYSRQIEQRRVENTLYENQYQQRVFENKQYEINRVRQEQQDEALKDQQERAAKLRGLTWQPSAVVRTTTPTKPRCSPLKLNVQQRIDHQFNGYNDVNPDWPYVFSALQLGPNSAKTRMTFETQLMRDRATKQLTVFENIVTLYIGDGTFKSKRGEVELTRADLNKQLGRHEARARQLTLYEVGGSRCFTTSDFTWSIGWNR